MTDDNNADLGLIGLAVMGQNLVLNMNDHGYKVAVYNRTQAKTDEFMDGPAAGTDVIGTASLDELVTALARPRRVMLMVKAGKPVDAVIDQLIPMLEPGDIIIDGGNSHYEDTRRRTELLEGVGLLFVGAGVSGGEEGARHGPSIMPGGSEDAWPHVRDILQAISAKVADGTPCCDWVGSDGAGHYVKMVPQRHRVRRHAGDRRGVPLAARRGGTEPDSVGRSVRHLVGRPPRLLPRRHHC